MLDISKYHKTPDKIYGHKLHEIINDFDRVFSLLKAKDFSEFSKQTLEKILAYDMFYSLIYAKNVLNGRFLEGEPNIARNGYYSLQYAKFLNRRFELGEPAIAENGHYALEYQALFFPNLDFQLGKSAIDKLNSEKDHFDDLEF